MRTEQSGIFHVWDVLYMRAYATLPDRGMAERVARDYQLRMGRPFEVRPA